ncbi:hypothetical protein SS50377_26960 [Spironucleus salmonicida]|uniref:Uncharacterized protein n=1 Tax=Spironucleus salmonicida TaxID=348837 RepID=A0A9P8LLR6_9EUKA|nr:hypothetical protein SS50377_26960 [Spironucleus salmonicida]
MAEKHIFGSNIVIEASNLNNTITHSDIQDYSVIESTNSSSQIVSNDHMVNLSKACKLQQKSLKIAQDKINTLKNELMIQNKQNFTQSLMISQLQTQQDIAQKTIEIQQKQIISQNQQLRQFQSEYK